MSIDSTVPFQVFSRKSSDTTMMLSCENRGANLIAGRGPVMKKPALADARASRSHVLQE
jgi:hypothetical protein